MSSILKNHKLTTLLAVLTALILPVFVAAQDSEPRFPISTGYIDGEDFLVERQLAPGVTHRFESRAELPITFNTVTIDTSTPDLVVETEASRDTLLVRETIPAMVARNADPNARPLVAINGGFWGAGNIPVNMFVDEGIIWKAPRAGVGERAGKWNAIYAFDDQGNHWIGQPDQVTMTLRKDDASYLLIDKVNFHEDSSYAVVYTWPLGEKTAPIREGQKQIILDLPSGEWLPNAPAEVIVREINDGPDAPLDHTTVVIHADTPLPTWLEPGTHLQLDARLPSLPGKVLGVVGGIPRIIVDGVADPLTFAENEGQRASFVTDLHPRTAIGIKEDGKTIVLVVVDGRQSHRSIGINLIDLAEYMKSLGCVQAINLDGGGSSTMVVRDELVNFPSDPGGPRAIGNALMVRRTAPIGPLASLQIAPSDVTIPTGSAIQFSVTGQDAGGEPVAIDKSTVTLASDNDGFTRLKGMDFMAATPGVYTLAASAGADATGQTTVTVKDAARIEFSPPAVLLDAGQQTQLTLRPISRDFQVFFHGITIPTITVPEFATLDQHNWTLRADTIGSGYLEVTLGGVTGRLPVSAGLYETLPAYSFDELPQEGAQSVLSLINANEARTTLEIDAERKQEGAASWKFTYVMASGGTTKIALDVNAQLPGVPLEVALWVYGDGQGQWLRGDLIDSKGDVYKLDFTDAQDGINWSGEWRFLRASLQNPQSLRGGAPPPIPPYTLQNIYVAQPQEARKKDGTIWIDGLCSVDLPSDLKEAE